MKYLLSGAVLLLMLATGMSLDRTQLLGNWRGITAGRWARLVLATFLIPPLLVLGLGAVLPIDLAALAGLYLVAVAPGAPLMTRNAAKRGFDLHWAASYQVWGALVAPLAIPLLVGGAAWLYGRSIWIPPGEVLVVVLQKQFAPLLAGMALMHFAPGFSQKVRRPMNIIGNVGLTVAIIGLLIKLGPTLLKISPWLALATVTLAVACLAAGRLLLPSVPTLAISNANRHVGLALLLSGAYLPGAQRALPSIAAYALAAPLVIAVYVRRIAPPPPAPNPTS